MAARLRDIKRWGFEHAFHRDGAYWELRPVVCEVGDKVCVVVKNRSIRFAAKFYARMIGTLLPEIDRE